MPGYATMEKTRRKLPAEWAGQTAPEVSGLTSPAGVSNQAMLSMLEGQQERPAARPASGGTPLADAMRAKFERQFGLPMDDVRIHRDSAEPAKFDAGAYTYGADIFIGPGQEELLNHEMTHVAQQKMGQVRPTGMEHGLAVNRSPALEHSADTGAVAQTMGTAAGPVIQCGDPKRPHGRRNVQNDTQQNTQQTQQEIELEYESQAQAALGPDGAFADNEYVQEELRRIQTRQHDSSDHRHKLGGKLKGYSAVDFYTEGHKRGGGRIVYYYDKQNRKYIISVITDDHDYGEVKKRRK